MNKKTLTKIISFVLVLCLILPIIPLTDIGIGGVRADAASAEAQASTTRYFKAGSSNYGYYSSGWQKGTTSYKAFAKNGETYLPVELIAASFNSLFGMSVADYKNNDKFSAACETVDGVECIKAVHGREIYDGYYIYVSNMNLVAIAAESTSVFNDFSNDEQITLMKRFLFDHLNDYSSDTSFKVNNALSASALTSQQHPYLMTNQTEFDYLYRQYKGELNSGEVQDEILKGYLDSLVAEADGIFSSYASDANGALKDTVNGEALASMPTNGYTNGYDVGGRQQRSPEHAKRISQLAFAYQVTRDIKYATLALNYANALSQWQHWGVGHFLNCADTSYSMALAYDWCYDIWGSINSTYRTNVRNALFTKGVMSGVLSSYRYNVAVNEDITNSSVLCPWYNPNISTESSLSAKQGGFVYQNRDNNWAAVCSSGMILAALALATEDGGTDYSSITLNNKPKSDSSEANTALSDYVVYSYKGGILNLKTYYVYPKDIFGGSTDIRTACVWLINNNMAHLEATGLKEYAPDGSYIESPTYWAYGTGSLMRTIAALYTTLGTDFGLSSGWGLDTTALFSYYAQSSDGNSWRYHDQGAGANEIETDTNAIYGAIIGDDTITAYRKYLVNKGGVAPSFYDVFMYDANVNEDDIALMPLDRYMEGIQGYTVRDTWEPGGVYAAFMGGPYIVAHGQLDSGAFVYHNNGTIWFDDIGCDNYNVAGYGYGQKETSLKYYPTSAEGNNTVSTNALTYGQYVTVSSSGALTDYGSANIIEHSAITAAGSYAVLDQSAAFTGVASSAKRGMLITNDRRTVVIQDEVEFNSGLKSKVNTSEAHTAYWFAHVRDAINITISKDGKTAYLTDGNSTIRCTIVTGNDDTAGKATFTVMDCAYSSTNMVLSGTDKTGTISTNPGSDFNGGTAGEPQNQYDAWQKLTVACKGITSMKLAIVIEELSVSDTYGDGYVWTDMSKWSEAISVNENSYDGRVLIDKDFDIEGIGDFSAKGGNFKIVNTVCDGDNAMGMYRTSSTNPSSITIAAAPSRVTYGTIGDGMLVFEVDINPLQALKTTSGTMKMELWGTDIYPNVSIDMTELALTSNAWNHLTVVIDEATDKQYVFLNNDLISSVNYKSRSLADLKLVIGAEGAFSAGQLLFDNAIIRVFNEKYTALDTYLKSSPASGVGITSWADKDTEYVPLYGNVARLYETYEITNTYDTDTPVVDFWSSGDETTAGAVVKSKAVYAASLTELQTMINSGKYQYVQMLHPTDTSISISKPITVDTMGYTFYATSDNLICEVTGDEYTYKQGELTVTYYVGTSLKTVTVNYTKPFNATITGSPITEHQNPDGTYKYTQAKSGCWANKAGADALSENERIVTSANCTFYSTGDPVPYDFVVVNGSSITGYYADEFLTRINSSYKRISVTNNFYVDGTGDSNGGNSVYTTTNIYLNGYTVTYYSGDSSDHMFSVGGGRTLNVYGPGTIDVTAPQSNLVFQHGNSQTNFNGVTIKAVHTLCDSRQGTLAFNDCDIYSYTKNSGLTATNYSGGQVNVYTDPATMGILKLNGGRLTYYGVNYAIEVKDNSRLVLTNGVEIVASNAKGAVLMWKSTSSAVDHIRVYLGNVKFNVNNIGYMDGSTACDPSVFADKIFYIEGKGVTDAEKNSVKYPSLSLDPDANYTVGEHVLARTGSAGYEWKIVKKTDAATVTWNGGNGSVTECWVSGAVPYAIGDAKAKLTSGTAYNMYSLQGKPVEAGKTYSFSAVTKASIDIRMSLSLNSNFNINFFVEKKSGIEYIMVNGQKVDIATLKVETLDNGGEYYAITINDIAPEKAAQLFSLVVNLGGDIHVTAVSSILNYAKKVLDTATSATTGGNNITANLKKLVVAIVEYVGAAADYTGDDFSSNVCKALASQYSEYQTDYQIYSKTPDTDDMKSVVKSVYLDLGAKPAFAFRFREDFSGTATIEYTDYRGQKVTKTVPVSYGIVSGKRNNVYLLVMKAFDMGTELTISATDENKNTYSCKYDLSTYYTQAIQDSDALYELLTSLGAYTDYARVYTRERENIS